MIAYITEISEINFTQFTNSNLSLVDIWAPWCGPCKLVSPIVDEISNEYHGQLSVGKLNADENSELVKELGIRNIPTLLFFKNGEQVKDSEGNPVKLVGNIDKSKIKEVIEEYISI